MIEPVYEKGYPCYEAVNRRTKMTDDEIVIRLHDIARTVAQFGACALSESEMRMIADRFAEYVKAEKEQRHMAVQG